MREEKFVCTVFLSTRVLAKGWLWLDRRIVEALHCLSTGEIAFGATICDESSKLWPKLSVFSFIDEASSTEELIICATPERTAARSLKSAGQWNFEVGCEMDTDYGASSCIMC